MILIFLVNKKIKSTNLHYRWRRTNQFTGNAFESKNCHQDWSKINKLWILQQFFFNVLNIQKLDLVRSRPGGNFTNHCLKMKM